MYHCITQQRVTSLNILSVIWPVSIIKRQWKLTGTAHTGTVLSFKGYLRSVIISFPTKRWNGRMTFRMISITPRRTNMIQSLLWFLAREAPWDLIVYADVPSATSPPIRRRCNIRNTKQVSDYLFCMVYHQIIHCYKI